jgi:hypothetical protein
VTIPRWASAAVVPGIDATTLRAEPTDKPRQARVSRRHGVRSRPARPSPELTRSSFIAASKYLRAYRVSDINFDINRGAQPRPSTHNGVVRIRTVLAP